MDAMDLVIILIPLLLVLLLVLLTVYLICADKYQLCPCSARVTAHTQNMDVTVISSGVYYPSLPVDPPSYEECMCYPGDTTEYLPSYWHLFGRNSSSHVLDIDTNNNVSASFDDVMHVNNNSEIMDDFYYDNPVYV